MPKHTDIWSPDDPSRLVIAITGHRRLPDQSAVAFSIHTVFAKLATTKLVLLSPLAEGADRLAAHEILGLTGGVLHAVLPLPADDYETDFVTPESRIEFQQLLAAAKDILVLPPKPTRTDAYFAVGCHLVNNCDILLAVWDGLPTRGMGGTADVVSYARELGKPMILIDSNDPTHFARERLPD